ncbi:hypothetical protein OOT46_21355 [Aquabacterium sp. A7-Y]|uniref:hypothetical protein n=1 Tax=Aquabacterium sp. A7-Y TaxID=1349605 RepID=UPI00223D733C|nr:hypothetical protein [Aquabacterium sp. A7-Y]MCW7540384.1 hypothetical protein [Aquabacterium sp. A7-Y]
MSRRLRAAAAGVMAAVGLVWWLRSQPGPAANGPATQPPAAQQAWGASPFGGPSAAAGGTSQRAPAPPAETAQHGAPDSAPPGVSPEQWQQLQDRLRDHPEREREIARLTDYLAYVHTMERFRLARSEAAPAGALRPLARRLDAGLDQRLARGELSLGEARLLKAALLQVLQPDAKQREAALALWIEQQAPPPAAADPRAETFRRQETALVLAWQALPPAQRDPQELQAQLDRLRQSVFGQER